MSLYAELKADYDAELDRINNEDYTLDEKTALINAAAIEFQAQVFKARTLCEIMGFSFDEDEDNGTTAEEVADAQAACEEVSGWNMDYIVFAADGNAKEDYTQAWLDNKEEFYHQCDEYFTNLLFNMVIMTVDEAEQTLGDIYSPDRLPASSEDGSIAVTDLATLVQAAQRDLSADFLDTDPESEIELIAVTDLKLDDSDESGALMLGNGRWLVDFSLLNDLVGVNNYITANSDRIMESAIVVTD